MTELGPCTPERKVLGELSNVKPEPLSPTANLRLLTTLASSLKSANELPANCDRNNSPVPNTSSSSTGIKLLPRKQKSLGLLCNKFLSMFPLDSQHDPPQEISLDCTAKALGTEKRRIYDIINILESLEMATKAGKNRYIWHGQKDLGQTLAKLKSIAIKKLGLHKQIHEIQKMNNLAHRVDNLTEDNHTSLSSSGVNNLSGISLDEPPVDEEVFNDAAFKEDKSLGAMCQKFLMLFLVSLKNGVINLDMAAKVLITDMDNKTDNASKSRFTTKVRRLYDIANVLTAIGLIDKVNTSDRAMRKPVFKYIGPNVYPDCLNSNSETPIPSCGSTPIGMSTPNKSCNSSNNSDNPINQEITINTWSGTRCKTFTNDLTSDTPTADKRKPRKRKLFDTDASSSHSTSLDQEKKQNQSLDRLDYSIFRVAEMELERLNSSEESKPKACKKLIIRYNSDSCIVQSSNSREKNNHDDNDDELQDGTVPKVVVSKENLVTGETSNNNTIFTYGNDPQTPKISRTMFKKNSTQKIVIQQPAVAQGNVIQLLPINTCQTLGTINKNINNNIKNESTCSSNVRLQGTAGNIINFANINGKKLIPIKRCDLKWSVPVESSPPGPGFAILTRIQAPVVSPGDTFKAVKVGNTLQLVPINVHCDNDNINNEDK